jgi:chemotaxis protein MotB
MKSGRWLVTLLAGGVLVTGLGCVSLDEHNQLKMSHRKLEAEKAALEQELYDTRGNSTLLRTKLASIEEQIAAKEALAANLDAENKRLQESIRKAQGLLEQMARNSGPGADVIIERPVALPPALDSALKQFAQQYPDAVYYDAKKGIVKWKSDLLFPLGSDVVKAEANEALKKFTQIMTSSAANGFDVLIVGHTDNIRIGRAETAKVHPTNWHLSAHRAIAVSSAMQGMGMPPTRIGVMGFGEYRPIASNASDSGRGQNRRVEIYVVPAGSVGGANPHQPGGPTTASAGMMPAMQSNPGIEGETK